MRYDRESVCCCRDTGQVEAEEQPLAKQVAIAELFVCACLLASVSTCRKEVDGAGAVGRVSRSGLRIQSYVPKIP